MSSRPLSRQRSPWRQLAEPILAGSLGFVRNVNDGSLVVFISDHGPAVGLHMSVSFRNHKGEHSRYPRWDEVLDAREVLLPPQLRFVMHLPPLDQYVSLHDTTFHLWELPATPTESP